MRKKTLERQLATAEKTAETENLKIRRLQDFALNRLMSALDASILDISKDDLGLNAWNFYVSSRGVQYVGRKCKSVSVLQACEKALLASPLIDSKSMSARMLSVLIVKGYVYERPSPVIGNLPDAIYVLERLTDHPDDARAAQVEAELVSRFVSSSTSRDAVIKLGSTLKTPLGAEMLQLFANKPRPKTAKSKK